ncbi:unnamed protein product [Meganyctiphanes norvegica]|uniref:XK-related protein n=1 Tax=Meganyctiphanes norvegica TaxID=48144 RepID=A0AAV2RZB1_MEGNR
MVAMEEEEGTSSVLPIPPVVAIDYTNMSALEVEEAPRCCCRCCGCCDCCCVATHKVKAWCTNQLNQHKHALKIVIKIISALLNIFDVGSDMYTAHQYNTRGDIWWASLTVLFILSPLTALGIFMIIIGIYACYNRNSEGYVVTFACRIMSPFVERYQCHICYFKDSVWYVKVLLCLLVAVVAVVGAFGFVGAGPLIIFGALVWDIKTSNLT